MHAHIAQCQPRPQSFPVGDDGADRHACLEAVGCGFFDIRAIVADVGQNRVSQYQDDEDKKAIEPKYGKADDAQGHGKRTGPPRTGVPRRRRRSFESVF